MIYFQAIEHSVEFVVIQFEDDSLGDFDDVDGDDGDEQLLEYDDIYDLVVRAHFGNT